MRVHGHFLLPYNMALNQNQNLDVDEDVERDEDDDVATHYVSEYAGRVRAMRGRPSQMRFLTV